MNTGETSITKEFPQFLLMEMLEPPGMPKKTLKVLLKPKISRLKNNQLLKVNTGETSTIVAKIPSQLTEMLEPPGMPKKTLKV